MKDNSEFPRKDNPPKFNLLLIGLGVGFVSGALVAVAAQSVDLHNSDQRAQPVTSIPSQAPSDDFEARLKYDLAHQSWRYIEAPDPMSDTPVRRACIGAIAQITYVNGASDPALCIDTKHQGNSVYLYINHFNFACSDGQLCQIRVQFDDSDPYLVPVVKPDPETEFGIEAYSDSSGEVRFANPDDFIDRLTRAARLKIEAHYEGPGAGYGNDQTSEFNVAGLRQDRLGLSRPGSDSAASALGPARSSE